MAVVMSTRSTGRRVFVAVIMAAAIVAVLVRMNVSRGGGRGDFLHDPVLLNMCVFVTMIVTVFVIVIMRVVVIVRVVVSIGCDRRVDRTPHRERPNDDQRK
jgi:hypothetical protein